MFKREKGQVRISFAVVLVVAIVFGFVSGIVGELWINRFLAPEIQFRNYSDLTKRLDALSTQQEKGLKDLLSEKDFSVGRVIEQVTPVVATFRKHVDTVTAVGLERGLIDTNIIGSGFVLTSDGWVVTHESVYDAGGMDFDVFIDGVEYPVEAVAVPDAVSGVVFVKVDASNLAVLDLSSKNQLTVSQSVLVPTERFGVLRTTLKNLYAAPVKKKADLLHNSESFFRYLQLNEPVEAGAIGAPVIDLEGTVVGVVADLAGTVVPVDYFSSVIKQAVQTKEITRPYIGLEYFDIEQATPRILAEGVMFDKGALIAAITPKSPAFAAGLQVGDVITEVENEEINRSHSLTELLFEYQVGDTVRLRLMRAGEQLDVDVVLGEK